MVRPAESIRKDLDGLQIATVSLAEEFSKIYATYLTVLGHALRRQMILATYHLCTQVYPEEFLALSVGDRARLQQGVQGLGRKGQNWLQQLMEPEPLNSSPEEPPRLEPKQLNPASALGGLSEGTEVVGLDADGDGQPEDLAMSAAPLELDQEKNAPDREAPEEPSATAHPPDQTAVEDSSDSSQSGKPTVTAELDPMQLMQSVLLAAMASEVEDTFSGHPFTGDPLVPSLVAKHHFMLERMIREVLQRASRHANRLLRRAQILPDLPEALLEMAAEADVGMPKGRSVPNVLNVMVAMAGEVAAEFEQGEDDGEDEVEAENDDDDEVLEANMTHLAAIHLRLTDLEFGDVQAALWRGKLRTLVGRLRKLGKQYQQAERELAIAEAEQAWRSVWYDDSSR